MFQPALEVLPTAVHTVILTKKVAIFWVQNCYVYSSVIHKSWYPLDKLGNIWGHDPPKITCCYYFKIIKSDIISNNGYKMKVKKYVLKYTVHLPEETTCSTSHLSPMQYLRIKDMQSWMHRGVGLLSWNKSPPSSMKSTFFSWARKRISSNAVYVSSPRTQSLCTNHSNSITWHCIFSTKNWMPDLVCVLH